MAAADVLPMEDQIEVDLREPWLALVLAWLWPGGGHFYQRRYAKGVLYMVCIMGVYLFGLAIGDGRVVYVTDHTNTRRWHFIAQGLVGAPGILAVVQRMQTRDGSDPLLNGLMTAPPRKPVDSEDPPPAWHPSRYTLFEMGVLYTVVAGLLNVLAMYDAFAGPAYAIPEEEKEKDDSSPEDSSPEDSAKKGVK